MDESVTLHLLGIFNTVHSQAFSHCAFTGKALRFPGMMRPLGYRVVEYSNAGSESVADEHVPMLTAAEYRGFYGDRKKWDFHGDSAVVGSPAHKLFDERLVPALRQRLRPRDIICHPFGHSHDGLLKLFPSNLHFETGIGYPTTVPGTLKIFESYAWMHYHQGKDNRQGSNYEWVIPNYFDVSEWAPRVEASPPVNGLERASTTLGYVAFLGRICNDKGMDDIKAIADHCHFPIVVCGQGDPSPWRHPNIHFRGPITGRQRSAFLRNARCLLMPTRFTEPFGGSGVEAMLCGTPLIAVDYGAFAETVTDGMNGFRCRTLQQWLDAIERCGSLDRRRISDQTRRRYSLEACGKLYDAAFKQALDLRGNGWFTLRPSTRTGMGAQ